MEFKTERIAAEFETALEAGRTIVPVLLYADAISRHVAGRDVLVTGILRTRAEQLAIVEAVNKQRIAAGLPPWPKTRRSVHEFWRGADLRWWIYTPQQVREIVDLLNGMFEYPGRFKVAALHQRGTAPHLHLQTPAGGIWKGA